jgi:D-alanyl-D-alanine carboxypeptidase
MPHSGNMNSTITDVDRWVRALGKGELLSGNQFQRMMGPSTAGLGPSPPRNTSPSAFLIWAIGSS